MRQCARPNTNTKKQHNTLNIKDIIPAFSGNKKKKKRGQKNVPLKAGKVKINQ
jgi:hypothetical protein